MPPQHIQVRLSRGAFCDFRRSRLFVAQSGMAERLVVFVHGFGGSGTRTWRGFEPSRLANPWWSVADLVFLDYSSLRVEIALTATRLRELLAELLRNGPPPGSGPREVPYKELILVGHSMGGVVIRTMILEVAAARTVSQGEAADASQGVRDRILSAKIRLFAPATAGARPTGLLSLAGARTSRTLHALPTYQELLDPSLLLLPLRDRTEKEVRGHTAGTADCLWASKDRVVTHGVPYANDGFDGFLRHTNHLSVCKPASTPEAIEFVQMGSVPAESLEGR